MSQLRTSVVTALTWRAVQDREGRSPDHGAPDGRSSKPTQLVEAVPRRDLKLADAAGISFEDRRQASGDDTCLNPAVSSPGPDFRFESKLEGKRDDADPIVVALETLLVAAREDRRPGAEDLCEKITGLLQEHAEAIHSTPRARATQPRGGLAPWQMRIAREMMESNLTQEVKLCEIAGQCGLSAGHFARAFRQSVGVPPHRWLLELRVERAKVVLEQADMSLSEIAQQCGFSDQSHFTRVFANVVGISPGRWRRRAAAATEPVDAL